MRTMWSEIAIKVMQKDTKEKTVRITTTVLTSFVKRKTSVCVFYRSCDVFFDVLTANWLNFIKTCRYFRFYYLELEQQTNFGAVIAVFSTLNFHFQCFFPRPSIVRVADNKWLNVFLWQILRKFDQYARFMIVHAWTDRFDELWQKKKRPTRKAFVNIE